MHKIVIEDADFGMLINYTLQKESNVTMLIDSPELMHTLPTTQRENYHHIHPYQQELGATWEFISNAVVGGQP